MNKKPELKTILILGLVVTAFILTAWYYLAPAIGLTVDFTLNALIMILMTCFVLAAALFLFPLIVGLAFFLFLIFILGWLVLAIVLFPILFPILVPIFVLALLIYWLT